MKAGKTNFELGLKIKIKEIKVEDSYLSGLTGELTHPFAFGATGDKWVGVYLDNGNKVNIRINEFEILN